MTVHPGWSGVVVSVLLSIGTLQFVRVPLENTQEFFINGLLETAWSQTQARGEAVRPWIGSENWVVGRLTVVGTENEQVLLANASGAAAYYAPSHMSYSVQPGDKGNSVIHVPSALFGRLLNTLQQDDVIMLESLHSGRWHYKIDKLYQVRQDNTQFLQPTADRRLTFISCYPCDSDSPQRYVLTAKEFARLNH